MWCGGALFIPTTQKVAGGQVNREERKNNAKSQSPFFAVPFPSFLLKDIFWVPLKRESRELKAKDDLREASSLASFLRDVIVERRSLAPSYTVLLGIFLERENVT